MHDASIVGFRKRGPGITIIAARSFRPGSDKLELVDVSSASYATLHYHEETVYVERIRPGGIAGAFIGTISGFEPAAGLQYAELKVGDDLAFQEEHVFTMGE